MRVMQPSMEAAIRDLSPTTRRVLLSLRSELPDTTMGRLLRGITAELLADQQSEDQLLYDLEAERAADQAAVADALAEEFGITLPQPPADGPALWHDPESGVDRLED